MGGELYMYYAYDNVPYDPGYQAKTARSKLIWNSPPTPKTCSISLSSNSINTNQSVTVNFSGNNNGSTSPSAPVNLWLEKSDFSRLANGPEEEVTYTPPSGTTEY